MADFLYRIDLSIFYFFNHTLSNPVFNKFFALITNVKNWMAIYILFALLLIIKGRKKGRVALALTLIMITATDQIGFRVLKEYFHRIRPCTALHDAFLPVGPTGAFSFPSNHALNNFAIATFFAILYPKYKTPLFITASLVAISRVYLGLHYPSDILGGAIIGTGFGFLFAYLHTLIMKYWKS